MTLSEIIIQKIKDKGPISFHDFMEMALYYPDSGYYTSASKKIGKEGDYYTSPYATTIFGAMIARQLKEMWSLSGEENFTIVEYGAGEGSLCLDILSAIKTDTTFFEKTSYCIIEKSPAMQNRQRELLKNENITWLGSISELKPFNGCVLANELIDNLAVHQVEMKEELMEVFVDYQDGFKEILKPAPNELTAYLRELNVSLPFGFRTEINLEAASWITGLSKFLDKGFVLVVDYGYSTSDFYSAKRSTGTLLGYYRHTVTDRLYENIGDQDITAHVNFSALKNAGLKCGLQLAGFTDQALFLRGLGLSAYLKDLETSVKNKESVTQESLMAAYRFMINMGQKLKVLVMHKNLHQPRIAGLQFALELE